MRGTFNNGMQFTAFVRQETRQRGIDPRLFLQEILLDDLLERIALSAYREQFVLKGGFLATAPLEYMLVDVFNFVIW